MSGTLSMYGAQMLLETIFGQDNFAPENYYLALCRSTAPSPYVAGDELDEPDFSTGYQRLEIPNNSDNWAGNGIPNVMLNSQALSWPPAVNDLGTFDFWALCDSSSEGNVIAVGDLEVSVTVAAGDVLALDSGEISIELGPFYQIPGS